MIKLFKLVFGFTALALLGSLALLAWFTRNVEGPFPTEALPPGVAPPAAFIGAAHTPQPIRGTAIAVHPFMAAQGNNSMHNDSYQSDSYPWSGPLGVGPVVDSAHFHPLVGSCVAAVTDRAGRLYSTCVTPFGVTLIARDPVSLEVLAREKITHWLPVGNKFGGGVYFHLDHRDRILLASNAPAIELWQLQQRGSALQWQLDQSIDLSDALDRARADDHRVIDVMPDWQGNYWFITRQGLVGVSDRSGATIKVIALSGEQIDNAFAVSANGVFIASNHAMYRFNRGPQGEPVVSWRQAYDRGSAPKPGTMGHGTGTTPTLLGEDYVAITDNADGRIKVVVYHQQPRAEGEQALCQVPVFAPDRGTSENSMVALHNSLIVENNFGYQGPFENISAAPGLARINVDTPGQRCTVGWENNTVSAPSSVPKVSLANGLIYVYTRDPGNPQDLQAWYFTALNAHTGELVYKILTGIGSKFNNHYGSISITADGTAYVGTLGGIVRVRDSGK